MPYSGGWNVELKTRTVYPGERNKGLSYTFQTPEEGRSVHRLKHCDKHGDKDEDNSPKNVNNVQNTPSQKYRHTHFSFVFSLFVFFIVFCK